MYIMIIMKKLLLISLLCMAGVVIDFDLIRETKNMNLDSRAVGLLILSFG